jgi:signal transduction histidine kinase
MSLKRLLTHIIRRVPVHMGTGLVLLVTATSLLAMSTEYDLRQQPSVHGFRSLQGPWLFYWNELLQPGEKAAAAGLTLDKLNVTWDTLKDPKTGHSFPSTGYATYKTQFRGLMPTSEGYEIYMRSVFSAYRAYLYPTDRPDELIQWHSGTVSRTKEGSVPFARPQIVSFHPRSERESWTLLIQTSNYEHGYGGILYVPTVGTGRSHTLERWREFYGAAVAGGTALIIGIYNLMIFLRWRKDKASLMLAMFCVTMGLRGLSTSYATAILSSESLFTYRMEYLFEYVALAIAPFFLGWFLHFGFDRLGSRRILMGMTVTGALLASIAVGLPMAIFTRMLQLFQVNLLMSCAYLLFLVFKAFLKDRERGIWSLAGCLVMLAAVCYDVLVSNGIVTPPYLLDYGAAGFVFLQSQVISHKFATAFSAQRVLARDLEKANQKIVGLNEELVLHINHIEEIVAEKTRKIHVLLDNIPIGLCTFGVDGRLDAEYSHFLPRIIDAEAIEGQDPFEIIFKACQLNSDELSRMRAVLHASLGESELAFIINQAGLPRELRKTSAEDERILEVDWLPIVDDRGVTVKILLALRDVTEHRKLVAENLDQQQRLGHISELVDVKPAEFARFMNQTRLAIEQARSLLHDLPVNDQTAINDIFISFHTLKGLARSMKFKQITAAIHDFESELAVIRDQHQLPDRLSLLAKLDRICDLQATYVGINETVLNRRSIFSSIEVEGTFFQRGLRLIRGLKSVEGLRQASQLQQLQTLFELAYLRSSSELLQDIRHSMDLLARDLDKPCPVLMVTGEETQLTPEEDLLLRDVFVHIVRNAMDHGIESAKERRRAGKEEQGRLVLAIRDDGKGLVVRFADDGRGLNLSRLYEQALKREIPVSEKSDPAQLADLIFHPGFSTARSLSDISGRGIGMHAVRKMIEERGGAVHIELQSTDDPGHVPFSIHMYIPHLFVAA